MLQNKYAIIYKNWRRIQKNELPYYEYLFSAKIKMSQLSVGCKEYRHGKERLAIVLVMKAEYCLETFYRKCDEIRWN